MGKAKKTGGRRSGMGKYVVKRIVLMFFTFFIISTICFMLVRLLPRELPTDKVQAAAIQERWEALDRKSTRLNSSHKVQSRMPSSA